MKWFEFWYSWTLLVGTLKFERDYLNKLEPIAKEFCRKIIIEVLKK